MKNSIKKATLAALIVMIGLIGCGAEENIADNPDKFITTISVNAMELTRVSVLPGTGIGAGAVDVITWKDGDKIAFWEVIDKSDSSQSDFEVPAAQHYNLAGGNDSRLLFALVGGAGTKEGVFAADGAGLDRSKLYVYSHVRDLNIIEANTANTKKMLSYRWHNIQNIDLNNSNDAVDQGLTFVGKGLVSFDEEGAKLNGFAFMNAIWEINLSNIHDLPDFGLSSIKIGYRKGSVNNFINYSELSINSSGNAQVTASLSVQYLTINTTCNPEISETPVTLRVPVSTMQWGQSINGAQELSFEITTVEGKVLKFSQTRTLGPFLNGTTYVIDLVLDSSPE